MINKYRLIPSSNVCRDDVRFLLSHLLDLMKTKFRRVMGFAISNFYANGNDWVHTGRGPPGLGGFSWILDQKNKIN